ncbi:hypothetical protein [Paractinoplanes durhamensis]|uniref:Uncharacterized protein n=1 Tax=Paractinoplanes durhamensis TaxID=113563 RepID=A0ABQ3Z3X4_9ACTN|nr:hypothetical protein [Actinoplanes durhamensis]GIE04543.1 hypothetical protein Adu01nite_58930 [Actinoplanes durhamensis]
MRARIDHRGLYVDLIPDDGQLLGLVRAVRAAGLATMQIEQTSDDNGLAVSVPLPDGAFAAPTFAAMLLIVAEVDNRPAATLIEDFRSRTGFDQKLYQQ